MKTRLTIAVIILSVAALIFCQAAVAADPVKDAKDAYTKFVKAAKAKNVGEMKKLMTKSALSYIEEIKKTTKEDMMESFMIVDAQFTPEAIKAAKAEVEGAIVTIELQRKDGASSKRYVVQMVKEDGQWKIAGPDDLLK